MALEISASMRAVLIKNPGQESELQIVECLTPSPGAGKVLIKTEAAGVNRADLMQRMGSYPPPPGVTDIPGLEVSGYVVAVGEGVRKPAINDHVCALLSGGGYADYCIAESSLCLPIPNNINSIQAAALPEAIFTVWSNVFMRGKLQPGETLLVHGGTSGIGTMAIQLGIQFGSRVIATSGSLEKCEYCAALGADPINYREEDFASRVMDLTHGKGVDVILDIMGASHMTGNLLTLADKGRLVIIALQGGIKCEINLLPLILKRISVTGSTLRGQSLSDKSQLAETILKNVWPLVRSGQISPQVHSIFPLSKAQQAHDVMMSSQHMGKLILSLNPPP